MKLVRPGPTGPDLFISSDMFYLEIALEPNGGVKDVKIHHEGRGEQVIMRNIFFPCPNKICQF